MDDLAFEYRNQARRGRGYLALGLGMVLFYAAVQVTAIPWIHGAIWLFLAVTLWRLARNRSGLLRITPARMEVFRNDRQLGTFPLARIESARLRRRKLGGDECLLMLTDGRHAYLPPEATPPIDRLGAELNARGIPLV